MKRFTLGLCLFFLMVAAPLSAQDTPLEPGDPQHLLELLAFVPDNANSRRQLFYSDFEAAQLARPLAGQYTTAQEFDADRSIRQSFYLFSLPGGLSFMNNIFNALFDMREAVGFEFFDIQRGVEFGVPPTTATVISGRMDPVGVAQAHAERGYEQTEGGFISIWCEAGDCNTGARTNFANRNLGNIFGGDLGRSQPVGITEAGQVFSAADASTFAAISDAFNGDTPSLASSPEHKAVVSALGDIGMLRQAMFLNPLDVYAFPADPLSTPTAPSGDALPVYTLLMLADLVDDTDEITVVAITYSSEPLATLAAQLLPQRLESAISARTGQPWKALLTERGVSSITSEVHFAQEAGRYVTLLILRHPRPVDSLTTERPVMSAMIYNVLYGGLFSRDLGWLSQ